jgi:polyisoprenoid-binding protein YceI
MIRTPRALLGLAAAALLAAPVTASAEPIAFKLLQNYSRGTFKTDAPLETVVGNTAGNGISGNLTVDPAKPGEAKGMVRVDMSLVKTGVDKRDSDMLEMANFLDAKSNPENKFVTFEVKGVEIAGPMELNKHVPAKIKGLLTVKGKPVERVADGYVTYFKLNPEQVEAQKRFGFTSDNVKVRARLGTLFTDHGMQVPQLLFLKVSNEIQIETDLTFVKQ